MNLMTKYKNAKNKNNKAPTWATFHLIKQTNFNLSMDK